MLNARAEARRRPVNLTVREDVVRAAKELGVNASQVAERALVEAVRRAAGERWLRENRGAIEAHNGWVAASGGPPLEPLWDE